MLLTPNQKHIASWLLIVLLAGIALWLLAPALSPFLVAAVLAYALNPLVNRIDDWFNGRMPRWLAAALVEGAFILLVVGMFMLIVPIVISQAPMVRAQLPELLRKTGAWLQVTLHRYGFDVRLDIHTVVTWINDYFANSESPSSVNSLLSSLKIGGSMALKLISNLLLIPLALYYLLADWNRFVALVFSLVPLRMRDAVSSFANEADAVLGQYLRGQLLVMLLLAVFYSLGLMLFGLDLAWPVGIFTGLAVFVPYLGFGLGLCMATLLGVMQMGLGNTAIMVAVVYGAGQILESFFLTPRLVGERIGLHPLAVIFALLAFGQLFGFIGILLALPTSAVLLVAIRRVRERYFQSILYKG